MAANAENPLQEIDQIASEIVDFRRKPLLVMYYPESDGTIVESDIRDIHDEFRARGWSRGRIDEELDVVLHTWGGDPNAAYRVSQVIRDFAKTVNFLIPFHAYSGGTLTCFCGNKIVLGDYACLGPIDITLEGVELASIEYYMRFAQDCRGRIEEMLQDMIEKRINSPSMMSTSPPSTDVERHLLVEMVRQIGALNVGRFFRERTLTGIYAYRLLKDYMFANENNQESMSSEIAHSVLFEFPSHDFDMDYHICKDLGLPVFEMNEEESDKTKSLINKLDDLVEQGMICPQLMDDYKAPFFRLYNVGGS
jgi:hypothetical protein